MAGYLKPEICKNCNITESKFYITTNNDDAKLLINFLNSNEIKKYLELCKYSGFNSRPVLESISYNDLNDYINDNVNDNVNDLEENNNYFITPEIIKDGRKSMTKTSDEFSKLHFITCDLISSPHVESCFRLQARFGYIQCLI